MDDGIRHFNLIKNSIRKTNPPTFCKWNEIGHNNHGLKIENLFGRSKLYHFPYISSLW